MIGNQPGISGHCDSKLVISTGWLAGHEVQLKDATENQEKRIRDCIFYENKEVGLLIQKCCLQNTSQLMDG